MCGEFSGNITLIGSRGQAFARENRNRGHGPSACLRSVCGSTAHCDVDAHEVAHDASHDLVWPHSRIVSGPQRSVDVLRRRGVRLYRDMTSSPSITPHDATSQQRPLLITVPQAADMLSLSRSSIYQLIWTDQLVPIRIGRSVRFSVEHLERFVADRSDVR